MDRAIQLQLFVFIFFLLFVSKLGTAQSICPRASVKRCSLTGTVRNATQGGQNPESNPRSLYYEADVLISRTPCRHLFSISNRNTRYNFFFMPDMIQNISALNLCQSLFIDDNPRTALTLNDIQHKLGLLKTSRGPMVRDSGLF